MSGKPLKYSQWIVGLLLAFVLYGGIVPPAGARISAIPFSPDAWRARVARQLVSDSVWPRQKRPAVGKKFILGLLNLNGNQKAQWTEFSKLLTAEFRTIRVSGAPVEVRFIDRIEDVRQVHALMVRPCCFRAAAEVLRKPAYRGILTISSADGFQNIGGIVRLVAAKRAAYLDVANLQNSGIKIGYRTRRTLFEDD
jgi:hypothetical protein